MEHGSDGQNGVEAAHAKNFAKATGKGMQHQRAVRINDAFRIPGGAGGKAHGGAVVFIDLRIAEIIAGFRKQLLVVEESHWYAPTTIGNDNNLFETGVTPN